jgi:hypothetical protein
MSRWAIVPIEERYWSKIDVRGPDDCWPWTGTCRAFPGHPELQGYGLFWDGTQYPNGSTRMVSAHVWGYKHRVGPIPIGIQVCHACDFRPCQNNRHWWLGTQGDNMRDAVAKGRLRQPDNSGENHGMHRLTLAQIEEIKARWHAGGIYQRELAAEFGVGQQQISRIVRGQSWH